MAKLVAAGRLRELRGIGPSIEARLRELVETGDIDELRELERTPSPELAALGRLLGFGAKRGAQIGTALGIRTGDKLLGAARAGRLREVPGIGPKIEARILEALEHGPRREPPRPLPIHRARPLLESIAAQLGGVATGDPRRWKDASSRLAVAVAADDPEPVRARFRALPEIVALAGPDHGVTVEGVPVELVVARRRAFGTALVRATGSPEWVAAHEPLPEAPDEEGVFRALGVDFVPPELREEHPVTVTGQSPLLELAPISAATCTRTRPGRTARRPSCRWARPRRLARRAGRRPRRAGMGAALPPCGPAASAPRADEARDRGDAPPGRSLPLARPGA